MTGASGLHHRTPLRLPSAKSGPLRGGAHLVLGSGRFPTLADWRHLTRRGLGPWARGVRIFAVEPTAVQLDWSALGPGPVRFECADTSVEVSADGGPGAVTLDHLPNGRLLTIRISGEGVPGNGGGDGRLDLAVTTPRPPPGEELARIATVSDLHVGEMTFGYLHTIGEASTDPPSEPHALRATRAATAEAIAWGAQRLVCKGDIVDQSHPGHWQDALEILGHLDVPVHLVAGNHEVKRRRSIDARDVLADSPVAYTDRVDVVEMSGASLVLVNSSVPDHERGQIEPLEDELIEALRDAPGGALVALHHHLRSSRATGAWPVGIPSPEANHLLDRVASAHPATMITSGHVHRNRLRRHGPITLTCVGSAKDYPGVWAGYVFYEGGISQVIRRVAEPSVIAWTERTGDALGGMYRLWTPSTLAKRCVSITWPTRD